MASTLAAMGKGAGGIEPSTGALVRHSRQELPWVRDDRLPHVEYREPATALALGAISGGGGYLYTGDTQKGLVGIAALIGAVAIAPVIPLGLGWVPLLGVIGWGAVGAWRQAQALNRYLTNRRLSESENGGHAPAQMLLASMPGRIAPPPSRQAQGQPAAPSASEYAELVTRLQRLSSIRASGVIDDNEFRARKIDILSEAGSGLNAEQTEALLFALLPLLDAGVLSGEDIQFVKDLGS